MSKNKYSPFFAAYHTSKRRGNPLSYSEVVEQFTNGRTSSLKELSDAELQELTRRMTDASWIPKNDKADRMRKAIIAIFKSMDKQTANAIAWAENQGVRGQKKAFNDYTTGELHVLISIAERIKTDWEKGIRKQVTKLAQ